jgi:hypothetical protein
MPRWVSAGLAATVLCLARGAAVASPVYAGCEAPPARPSGHSFFVDPLRGSPQGDGSRAHPWRTLAEVVADGEFATAPILRGPGAGPVNKAAAALERATGIMLARNPNAPIKPGDTVYLLSGDHGAVTLQGAFGPGLVGYANPEFITIEALPGQTPIVRQLQVLGGNKWVFRGLTFQSVNDKGSAFRAGEGSPPDYFLVMLMGPHDNIVLDHNHFLSAPDVTTWALADWVRWRASGVKDYRGKCISIVGNVMENVGFGIETQSSDKVLLSDNVINYFADDGIDYGSSELLIDHNRITNSIEDGDGIHRDAMQGQPVTRDAVIKDVTISNNTVIRIADPRLKYPGYLQGIDTFDGVWKNVTVANNIVVTDAGHGISYYGVDGLTIEGNVLLADGMKVLPCSHITFEQCLGVSVITDKGQPPRIAVMRNKTGAGSSDVLITRNIASGIGVDISTVDSKVVNNVCVPTNGKCGLGYPLAGKMFWAGPPGVYPTGNVIVAQPAEGLFVKFDSKGMKYDFKLKKPLFKDKRT